MFLDSSLLTSLLVLAAVILTAQIVLYVCLTDFVSTMVGRLSLHRLSVLLSKMKQQEDVLTLLIFVALPLIFAVALLIVSLCSSALFRPALSELVSVATSFM